MFSIFVSVRTMPKLLSQNSKYLLILLVTRRNKRDTILVNIFFRSKYFNSCYRHCFWLPLVITDLGYCYTSSTVCNISIFLFTVFSFEAIIRIRLDKINGTFILVCFGWQDVKCKCCFESGPSKYLSIFICLYVYFTSMSRKGICFHYFEL